MKKQKVKLKIRHHYIIGIDEAGRGPIAGPLIVAGIKLPENYKTLLPTKDSKLMTAKQRGEWFLHLTSDKNIVWAVKKISPKTIDRINIYQAAQKGAFVVYKSLENRDRCLVLLDGGLRLPKGVLQRTIVKGDQRVAAIAAASIIAKVTRDRIMFQLHKKYPSYRLDIHKGYCTKIHCDLIKQFGYSEVHRKSFRFDK